MSLGVASDFTTRLRVQVHRPPDRQESIRDGSRGQPYHLKRERLLVPHHAVRRYPGVCPEHDLSREGHWMRRRARRHLPWTVPGSLLRQSLRESAVPPAQSEVVSPSRDHGLVIVGHTEYAAGHALFPLILSPHIEYVRDSIV